MPNSTGSGLARSRVPTGVTIALLACALAIATATPSVVAAAVTTSESVAVFEGQLKGHQVTAIRLHPKAHSFRVTLTDGNKATVVFSASEQQRLLGEAKAHGITVKVTKVQQPSHKRRDLVIGAAIVVVVLAVAVGGWLYVRRRRMREEEHGPQVR